MGKAPSADAVLEVIQATLANAERIGMLAALGKLDDAHKKLSLAIIENAGKGQPEVTQVLWEQFSSVGDALTVFRRAGL